MPEGLIITDGDVFSQTIIDDDLVAHTRVVQKSAPAILAMMNELRKSKGAIRSLSFGRWELSIPMDHYQMLLKQIPALSSIDPAESELAWRAFMQSSASGRYRMTEKKRGVHANPKIQIK